MEKHPQNVRTLSGWKQIANHMHQGVRTVQRWEQIGLPIHRIRTSGPVVAFAEELDAWERSKPMHILDVVVELKIKIERLEAEVLSLKGSEK
jgi:phage terminase Nu1 subunit (DNA packaging protein)